MNAAEITDKLGLHSLRNRAWVCFFSFSLCILKFATNNRSSTSNQPVLLPGMVFMRDWNGSVAT